MLETEAPPERADGHLDTLGLYCPLPIIKTAARMRGMRPGETLEVISSDRVILVDMPAWCRSSGNAYLGARQAGEREFHVFVRKAAPRKHPA
ncbi:MAG: sulfurtransferase TusA family protein [Acidobacteria bacterium]|nr:sulfurtransferase TusA family protein [Acidobacteriota bacterium]